MSRAPLLLVIAAFAAAPLRGQTAPAPAPPVFSGLIFGSYNYQLSPTGAPLPSQANNAFVVDRAYLTFRMPVSDRLSVRVTTDIYQSTEAAAVAYTVRAKFAYLQYDSPKHASGAQLTGRLGILQNVVIDHFENFWPRYTSPTPVERALFFSSADVGIAGLYTLPNKAGEIYATIVNGPGFATRERDRFKDFAARLTLTPLQNRAMAPLWQGLTLTTWFYKGATASTYVNGGAGQVGPIGEALDRSRGGVFAGIREPRFSLGTEYAIRHDGGDAGDNTAISPRTRTETTAHLMSGMLVARPLAFVEPDQKSPYGVLLRYDRVKPTASTKGFPQITSSSDAYHSLIAGVFADLSPKVQVALDYQEQLTSVGKSIPPNPQKGYFLHWMVNF